VEFIGASPLGPIVTNWINLSAALVPIGFLYVLFRKRKDEKLITWAVACMIMLALMALWLTPQQSSAGAYPDRIYIIGSIFFTSFSASILCLFGRHKYLKIIPVIFLLLNLPMNMFLPAHQSYVVYHTEENISADVIVIRQTPRYAEFELQIWADEHTTQNSFLTCIIGGINVFYIHGQLISSDTPFSNESDPDYVFLDHFTLLHGLWRTWERSYESVDVDILMNKSSVVYNNGKAALLSPKQ